VLTSAGASFVIRNDAGITSAKDLGGKKFASPQLGNMQDVALRNTCRITDLRQLKMEEM
jgi:NitT/TauT family transport system substrate-binding protein